MRKHVFLTSLGAALLAVPLFVGCGGGSITPVIPEGGLTLPDCTDGQNIAVGTDRTLSCTQAFTSNLSPPACPQSTHALNAYSGMLVCVPKGTGSTNTDLQTAINNVVSQTQSLNAQVLSLSGGGGAAKYCGQTGNTNGAITSGGVTGIAGAADLCSKVAACGAGAHMCTPYEMFESVSSGTITSTQTITKSWVYMASWQNFGQASQQEATAGMNDNCGAYTYPTADRKWQGSAVKWENAVTGSRALKFFTGVDSPTGFAGQEGAPCNAMLPVACCK